MEGNRSFYGNLSLYNETNLNGSFVAVFQPPFIHISLIIVFLVLYAAVILIGIGGNALICNTIFSSKQKTVTNFFIASLAGSDILMAVVCIPFTVLSNLVFHYWPFGAALCPVVGFVQVTSVLQRAFSLVTITFDQHSIIWHPLRKRFDKKKARILIVILWMLAGLASCPVLLNAKIMYLSTGNGKVGVCMEDWNTQKERYIYSIVVMILQYFLPLLIMIICYTHIGIIVWKKNLPGESDISRDKRQGKNKRKTLKMLVAIVIAYALSWLPFHTLTLVGDSYPRVYDLPYMDFVWMAFHWLAFSSTGMNPVIYCHSNGIFNKLQKRMFSTKRDRSQQNSLNMHQLARKNVRLRSDSQKKEHT